MLITVLAPDRDPLPAYEPLPGSAHVIVDGPCPSCHRREWRACGVGPMTRDDRTITSACHCLECRTIVGTIRVEWETLFGATEDAAVLGGPWKVF